jgi:hypothetical protein
MDQGTKNVNKNTTDKKHAQRDNGSASSPPLELTQHTNRQQQQVRGDWDGPQPQSQPLQAQAQTHDRHDDEGSASPQPPLTRTSDVQNRQHEGLIQRRDRDRPYPASHQRQAHHDHAHGERHPFDNYNDSGGNGRAMYSRQQHKPSSQFEGEEAYRMAQRKRSYNNDHPPYHHNNNERRHEPQQRPQARRYNCASDDNGGSASAAGHAVLASVHAATKAFVLHPPQSHNNASINIGGKGVKLVITLERGPDGTMTGSSIAQTQINNIDADVNPNPAHNAIINSRSSVYDIQDSEADKTNVNSAKGAHCDEHEQTSSPPSLADLERQAKWEHQQKNHLEHSPNNQYHDHDAPPVQDQEAPFVPNPNDVAWEKQLHALLLYKRKSRTWVLNKAVAGHKLCSWVKRQRYQYRNTFKGAARIPAINAEDTDSNTKNTTTSPKIEKSKVHIAQDKYERLYHIGFPFPKMVAEEFHELTTSLKLFPPTQESD